MDQQLRVTVQDTQTGQTIRDILGDVYYWTEGNGSCDCNRGTLFNLDAREWPEGHLSGRCAGNKRFRIVMVDPLPPGHTLQDFNTEYSRTEG